MRRTDTGRGQPPPARNIYDLLRLLIEKQNWADEGEKREYLDAVNYAQQLRAFGDREITK